MGVLLQILQLLPFIIQTVQTVEQAIPIAGAGQQKLDLVLNAILAADADASKLIPIITKIIGNIVSTLNAVGVFKKA